MFVTIGNSNGTVSGDGFSVWCHLDRQSVDCDFEHDRPYPMTDFNESANIFLSIKKDEFEENRYTINYWRGKDLGFLELGSFVIGKLAVGIEVHPFLGQDLVDKCGDKAFCMSNELAPNFSSRALDFENYDFDILFDIVNAYEAFLAK